MRVSLLGPFHESVPKLFYSSPRFSGSDETLESSSSDFAASANEIVITDTVIFKFRQCLEMGPNIVGYTI